MERYRRERAESQAIAQVAAEHKKPKGSMSGDLAFAFSSEVDEESRLRKNRYADKDSDEVASVPSQWSEDMAPLHSINPEDVATYYRARSPGGGK